MTGIMKARSGVRAQRSSLCDAWSPRKDGWVQKTVLYLLNERES